MFGYKYFLTIVMTNHDSHLLQAFVAMVETQFSTKIKCICSDNGPEFNLTTFYSCKGTLHHTSYVETPQ